MHTQWTLSAIDGHAHDDGTARDSSRASRSRETADHGTETILLIEDKSASRERFASALAGKGYSVVTAEDGMEGVALFRSFENYVDLAIIDYSIPRLSGFEAAVSIRNINPDVKIILMIGDHTNPMIDEMRERGIDDILVKPFTIKAAMKSIRTILEKAAQ
jgi:two-component system, cell cycle sensor histidine kinase and response regulator CckA